MTVKSLLSVLSRFEETDEVFISDDGFDISGSVEECFSLKSFKTGVQSCVLVSAKTRSVFSFCEDSKLK